MLDQLQLNQGDLGLSLQENRHEIGAVTCDFLQCGILTSVDLDKPVQPPFKLRNLT